MLSAGRMTPAPVLRGMWIGWKPLERTLVAALLHVPPGVAVVDDGREGEVVGRRRRGGRPFQRAAVPRIAGRVAQLLALADADVRSGSAKARDAEQRSGSAPNAAMTNQICSDGSSKWRRRRVTPIRPST